jgi:hypothetical protein
MPSVTASPAPVASPPAACTSNSLPLIPEDGVYFGVNLDWGKDSPAEYSERLRKVPAVLVLFADFPMDEGAFGYVRYVAGLVRAQNAALMLTLEPNGGLESVTPESAKALAEQLAAINQADVPVYLRFAHEMNGSWYAWSQDPEAYVRAFREVADAVHALAPRTATVWAPNYGGGYPFAGGQFEAAEGSAARALLDTNGDGTVSVEDDPYAPYYPGDDAVDWVGMSLYHWGAAHPWGENEVPEPDKFTEQLTGEYNGTGGDYSALPDFYADYAVEHGKPLAITETAALYAVGVEGDAELELKQDWWQQVFGQDLPSRFPQLKMINWFEWRKFESEIGGQVDWTVTQDATLHAAFQTALPDYLRFAESVGC